MPSVAVGPAVSYAGLPEFTLGKTARLLRRALTTTFRTRFPGVSFSVTTGYCANATCIDVMWTDGPAVSAVGAVLDQFRSYEYDEPGLPLRRTRPTFHDGVLCRYSHSMLCRQRDYSESFLAQCRAQLLAMRPALVDGGAVTCGMAVWVYAQTVDALTADG